MKPLLQIAFSVVFLLPSPLLSQNSSITQLPLASSRYAVLIGVDHYSDLNISSLPDPSHDVSVMRDALIKYGGFVADNITVLSTSASTGNHPTRPRILTLLAGLQNTVPDDALLVFMFSGHGITRDGKAFLLPEDAVSTGNTTLLGQTSLSIDDIRDAIAATHVKQAIVILDACRDDPTVAHGLSGDPLTQSFIDGFDFASKNHSVVASAVLYASKLNESAFVDSNSNLGYLTEFIVDGMKGNAANANGDVTLGELLNYVQTDLPKKVHTDHPGDTQTPYSTISGYLANNLVFAHVPKKVTILIPPPANSSGTGGVNSATVPIDTSSLPTEENPNANPVTRGDETDPRAPLTLQTPTFSYDLLFRENQTDAAALSNLGRAAFRKGDYSWTIKFLDKERSLDGTKINFPYLAASYWLANHDDFTYRQLLSQLQNEIALTHNFLERIVRNGEYLAELQTAYRLLPQQQQVEMDPLLSNLKTEGVSPWGNELDEGTLVCTFASQTGASNATWLVNNACIIPDIKDLDLSYHQSKFKCCGGVAKSPTKASDIPPGLDVVVTGNENWSVANPLMQSDKLTVTNFCGPKTTNPAQTPCYVRTQIYAHYRKPL